MILLFSLFGITTLQTFIYFKGNPQDRGRFQLLVRKAVCNPSNVHAEIF